MEDIKSKNCARLQKKESCTRGYRASKGGITEDSLQGIKGWHHGGQFAGHQRVASCSTGCRASKDGGITVGAWHFGGGYRNHRADAWHLGGVDKRNRRGRVHSISDAVTGLTGRHIVEGGRNHRVYGI